MANQTGLEPASAIVQLQNLRVQEATDGVTLARKQNAKADFGADQYGNLIRAGLNTHARDLLQSCWQFKTLRDVADVFDAAIGIAQMAGQVAGIDKLFTRSGGHQAAARAPAVGYVGKAAGGGFIDNAQARLDSDTLLASHENRVADWNATANLHSVRPLAASSNWRGRGCHRRPAGLTGSERLLQPIYQHDQYAFQTEKRKLNLTQTFSPAQPAPLEFGRFRET